MLSHLSVRNVTRTALGWAASPVGRLARVEVLVTLSCGLLALLVFLGSGRRASASGSFRFIVWAALMLSYPAVSYTIGLMQSAYFRNELVVIWGCFLLLILGCADGIAAYSLEDFDQQARTMLNQALQVIYVLTLLISYASSLPKQLAIPLFVLWFLSAAKLGMRLRSFLLSGRDRVLTFDNKLMADFMLKEHGFCGAEYDAVKMTGYKYVVAGETNQEGLGEHGIRRTNDLVTVDLVWRCDGELLGGGDEAAGKRRDLCLSFALFKLLRRRLGGYPIHEARLNKTRDFVWKGLLGEGHDHERMFRVVEVELGFLFDFYYTRHPSPKETLIPDTAVFAAVVATSLSVLLSSTLLRYQPPEQSTASCAIKIATTGFDIWLTRMVIILFLILESFQYFALLFSDWFKVKMLCRYVLEPCWHGHPFWEPLLRLMCRVRLTRYWNNSLGQHSLLHACFQTENSCILRAPLPESAKNFLLRFKTTHQQSLPAPVKLAIYRSLKSGRGRLRHGECALERNEMLAELSWAIDQESTVHSILIWHVATTMCHMQFGTTPSGGRLIKSHQVATVLSDYCCYLVSSAPELLPGHSFDAQLLFQKVQSNAQQIFRGCRRIDDMYDWLESLYSGQGDPVSGDTLVEGAKLGIQLLRKTPEVRWKVLDEVWVEMLLSVAPSENVTGHVRKLATGGELITHLWALLTHAGIVDTRLNRYQRRGP
ncbi:uncharacterized protein LOC104583095 [Brachypodium distachyon]|uniref:DUF4220 domain-containing protein n=1 Tax=Brachypodium distachyon TaxID=15368 RepID=I1HGG8_BRADI|nr:uncharacterized protein LOC104583095 [Brachypodium distachyon]KQK04902.1 hypothetical protein BRADI_2g16700v3 [Brachypodium distachyon]|eukprot:XP_014755174.1 uncharacterized protein LOC104583095 [Brachypodium distachyon]